MKNIVQAQQTGLLWFLKDSLTQEQQDRIKTYYTYINPKDQDNIFSTFIELKDKIGVPYGDKDKIRNLLQVELEVQDNRISPKFKKKKVSKLKLRDYQELVMKDIMTFINNNGTSFNLSGEPGCVDKDTEFLSLDGWKKISEYKEGDLVGTYKDGIVEFEKPLTYIVKPCDKWINLYSGTKHIAQLSEEHRVVYKTSKGNMAIKTASNLLQDKNRVNLITNANGNNLKGIDLSDDLIRLQCAIAADGTKLPQPNKFRLNLKKQHKISRLRILLKNCKIDYTESFSNVTGYTVFYFYVPDRLVKSLLPFYSCNTRQLKIIAEEVLLWDGSQSQRTFYSTIKEEADFVQYCFTLQGYTASMVIDDRIGEQQGKYTRKSKTYEVRLTKDSSIALNFKSVGRCPDTISEVPAEPNDLKYCFTVSSGMFFIRKNLKVHVTGNSGKSFMLANILANLGTKTLIIAHLSQLTKQLAKEIEAVLGYKPQILDKDTKELADINIATSQLISKNPDLWYLIKKGIGCIVIDEAETLASLSTLRIVQRAHAKYHIFISATFTRSVDHRTEALIDFAGPNVFTLKNPALLKPQVITVQCSETFTAPMDTKLYNLARGRFYKRDSISDKVLLITKASLRKNRQVLIACDVVELQLKLKDLLTDIGIKSECINSGTKASLRDSAMVDFDNGDLQVLIGFGTLNAGLSIPKISTIIRVATPSSQEKLEQLIGRARRDFDGKDGAFVIDLMFQGFNNDSRLKLYKKKRRQDDWKLNQTTWDEFERKIK